jgi:hypothetical protein
MPVLFKKLIHLYVLQDDTGIEIDTITIAECHLADPISSPCQSVQAIGVFYNPDAIILIE